MKYIDADRLKTFVQARRDMHYDHYVKNGVGCISEYKYDEDDELLDLIDVLQQEQPELDLEKASRNVYESWMGGTMNDVRRDMVELGKVLNARKEK